MKSLFLFGAAMSAAMMAAAPASVIAAPAAATRVAMPQWTDGNDFNDAGRALVATLERAQLDGFASGPLVARRAETLLKSGGSPDEVGRMLTDAWVGYVQAVNRPASGMDYADPRVKVRPVSRGDILSAAASTPSLAGHVRKISAVNPIYDSLREAAWRDMQLTGRGPDQRVLDSLARVRTAPTESRYIIVDTASAKLWMVEDGQIAGTMKVITGDSANATPMIASAIHYATFNPVWNVPQDLVRSMIAPRVRDQGTEYLTERDYEVFDGPRTDSNRVDPNSVDWAAVARGETDVRLRRGPGEWNSMGNVKFGFENDSEIFLHDTPDKSLFAKADRNLSHGCVRLEDAPALVAWLMDGKPVPATDAAEQHIRLPKSVPIYLTYLTAQPRDGRIAFNKDVYGLDSGHGMRVAGGR